MDKLLLGIDFGTSTNFVTKYDFNKKDALAVAGMGKKHGGPNIFNNCIYIQGENSYVIGDSKRQHSDPENFFEDVKRYIIDDNKIYRVPNLNNRAVTAQDIAEMVFKTIIKKVEDTYAGQKVDGAVITVPYSYGKKYRQRLQEAATNAGLNVIKLIEEPVAAAISYGIFGDKIKNNQKEKIAVFDLGGGTFDITIFNFEKSDAQNAKIEVLNTDGVEKLGGKTIDELLSRKFMEYLKIDYSIFSKDKERNKFQSDLNELSKETKECLSYDDEEVIETLSVNGENKELEMDVSVDNFNDWLKDNNIIGEIEDALDRAIYDIDLEPKDIDRVVLAGGTSTIPLIKNVVEEFFGKKSEAKKDLGELVGHGAGILAGLSEDSSLQYTVIRKTSKNIGVASGNKFKKILHKNTKYGEESAQMALKLTNREESLNVSFYEGDSARIEDSEKIGKVEIDGRDFSSEQIYISLEREDKKDSKIKAFFYDKEKNLVCEKYLEDV